jgi:hypothetical protein
MQCWAKIKRGTCSKCLRNRRLGIQISEGIVELPFIAIFTMPLGAYQLVLILRHCFTCWDYVESNRIRQNDEGIQNGATVVVLKGTITAMERNNAENPGNPFPGLETLPEWQTRVRCANPLGGPFHTATEQPPKVKMAWKFDYHTGHPSTSRTNLDAKVIFISMTSGHAYGQKVDLFYYACSNTTLKRIHTTVQHFTIEICLGL